jgi:hypothetical protein
MIKAANTSIRRVPRTARTVVMVLVCCFGSVSTTEAEPSVGNIEGPGPVDWFQFLKTVKENLLVQKEYLAVVAAGLSDHRQLG